MRDVRLRMVRGDDREFPLALRWEAAAIDLTGAVVRFTAKYRTLDADDAAVIAKDSATGGVVIDADPLSGNVTVVLDAADTVDLSRRVTTLVWDVQVLDAYAVTHTPMSGTLEVRADVTVTSP